MQVVEFTVELGPEPILTIPQEAAAQLPKIGQARIIVLVANDADDAQWREAAYAHFLRNDPSADAVYDACLLT